MDDFEGGYHDTGEADEYDVCVGGHDVCPTCDYEEPAVVSPGPPDMWTDGGGYQCGPGDDCTDGYLGWDIYSEEIVGQQTCGVSQCWTDETADYLSGESAENYWYCKGSGLEEELHDPKLVR